MAKRIFFYLFSGTGNTFLLYRSVRKAFEEAGYVCEAQWISRKKEYGHSSGDIIGILVPVAVQSTFPFIFDFLRTFPGGDNELFFLDTLGAYSGGLLGPVKKILLAKGYFTAAAQEIVMPSNFFKNGRNPEEEEKTRRQGLEEGRRFVRDFINGEKKWPGDSFWSPVMQALSGSSLLWKMLRKKYRFTVDPGTCIRCGRCLSLCPVENITMEEIPCFAGHCEFCLRCVTFCPTGAISVKGEDFVPYRAVEYDDFRLS
ncbi:MAG TPA: EFR1 family ferrodoxin [Candidatus Mcinerneyibacteriales bacterium]|nr:EFR1 family ferrodoxin [Candidatus Mcinerneyibacteriales bacterium]HPE21093.1 EFR1 family ferrodoxin [Candidatus Mcinerneyibacteriales bacterium]HPQ88519.1 EFR1 family ferrodoxin [Candidatus Mcinerneyibacteriales bacterium]